MAVVSHPRSVALLALALAMVGACTTKTTSPRPAPVDVEAGLVPIVRTTDGAIAIGNLDGVTSGHERRVAATPGDIALRAGLVDLLLTRGEVLGSIADYERASELAETLVREAPQRPEAWQARAGTNATWHRFEAALDDLRAAENAGANPASLARSRSAILAATGKLDEARRAAPSDADLGGDSMALASRALIEGELGNLAAAEGDLAAARARYHELSPLPLAWMDAMEAALHEKNGDRTKARAYYTRANRILPLYAKAAAHLATYETPERALAILQPVAARSDDPEVHAELGDALRRIGRTADSQLAIARARASYESLVVAHREAFADHAARFWMGAGADQPRALPLAAANAKLRRTDEALALWLEAGQAAHDAPSTCEAALALAVLPHATEPLRAPARAALARCPGARAP